MTSPSSQHAAIGDQSAERALDGAVAVVTGAGRGLGRGTAIALVGAGARVVGVSRTETELLAVRDEVGESFIPVVGDATDEQLARDVIATHSPNIVVLNAGAVPHMAPVQEQTWESFTRTWETDVRAAFEWTRAALLAPLRPGSTVIAMSAGAALRGSPLSGGFAGAEATMRLLATHAAGESTRAGLGIRFPTLITMLTPLSAVGAAGSAAYSKSDPNYLDNFKPFLTMEQVGAAIVELAGSGDGGANQELLLTGAGVRDLSAAASRSDG